MSTRFIQSLRRLDFDPTAEEIADILWLASHLDQPEETEPEAKPKFAQTEPEIPFIPPTKTPDAPQQGRTQKGRSESQLQPHSPPRSDLYFPQQTGTAAAGSGALPYRSPAASALPGALAISRALRPLMRRVPSRTTLVLDEETTVQRIADEGNWLPVLRPASARWLDVVVIVDQSPSMVIWRQTIGEWQRLLERQGAFRNIQIWQLIADANSGATRLSAGSVFQATPSRARSPYELIDPQGRRLILLVSDCVSQAWRTGEVARLLGLWNHYGPVAIVQVLPERLWGRSALGDGVPIHLRARTPGTPNTQLEIEIPWDWVEEEPPAGVPVPIVTLEPESLAPWAQSVAGMGSVWIPGVILPTRPSDGHTIVEDTGPQQELAALSAVERLQAFQATASPLARRLAGYLAAAPLSLPVMRLVQRVMLPESRQVHLAEVLLSGLIKQQKSRSTSLRSDDVHYEFVDGVRELLLSSIRASEAIDVLVEVSNFVEKRTGQSLDFLALLADPDATGQFQLGEENRPFATVAARVLRRLGGNYARLAARLRDEVEGIPVTAPIPFTVPETEARSQRESTQYKIGRVRPPRVHITYEVQIGDAIEKRVLPFVVGVLADLSGQPIEPLPRLRDRKFIEIDRDNFDAVLRSMKPRLAFTVENRLANADDDKIAIELRFSNLVDFGPDSLVNQTTPLRELLKIRGQLAALLAKTSENGRLEKELFEVFLDTKLFQRLSEEIRARTKSEENQEKTNDKDAVTEKLNLQQTEGTVQAREEESLLDQIITRSRIGRTDEQREQSRQAIVTLVNEVIQKTIVLSEKYLEPLIRVRIADINRRLSEQLNWIMHDHAFQKLEASWRGLHYLVNKSDTSTLLKIKVLNVSKDDLRKDIERANEFDQSSLFRKVYEEEYGTFGGALFGALIGDYEFGLLPQDLALLEQISHVAAVAHAPFIAAASPHLFDLDSFTEIGRPRDLAFKFDSPEYVRWHTFRESEDARYVGMTLPHFLLRLPYGPETVPVEAFNFTEDVERDHNKYLWGNPAYAFATRLTDAFAKYQWCAAIRGLEGGGLVEGLPTRTFRTDDGDIVLKCPTEIAITDRREKELSDLGFLPLIHCKGTDYAAFFGAQSCAKPRRYASDTANTNAHLAIQLQYIMAVSRFAHYLKAIMRDMIGSFMSRDDCEQFLNRWIVNYVLMDDDAGQDLKAQFPLREARIDVDEIPGKPGVYRAVAYLRPHFQLDEISTSLRIVVELPLSLGHEALEYVVVQYPEQRDVFITGKAVGKTQKTIELGVGYHTFDLGEPRDYEPESQEVLVRRTTQDTPLVVTFTRKRETAQ